MLETSKRKISDYTRSEFSELLEEIATAKGGQDYQDGLINHFIEVCPHPDKSDLIFWPADGDPSTETIVQKISQYCNANGLSGFK